MRNERISSPVPADWHRRSDTVAGNSPADAEKCCEALRYCMAQAAVWYHVNVAARM